MLPKMVIDRIEELRSLMLQLENLEKSGYLDAVRALQRHAEERTGGAILREVKQAFDAINNQMTAIRENPALANFIKQHSKETMSLPGNLAEQFSSSSYFDRRTLAPFPAPPKAPELYFARPQPELRSFAGDVVEQIETRKAELQENAGPGKWIRLKIDFGGVEYFLVNLTPVDNFMIELTVFSETGHHQFLLHFSQINIMFEVVPVSAKSEEVH